jgi:hypothetical protein
LTSSEGSWARSTPITPSCPSMIREASDSVDSRCDWYAR